jgi:hypothetical protein
MMASTAQSNQLNSPMSAGAYRAWGDSAATGAAGTDLFQACLGFFSRFAAGEGAAAHADARALRGVDFFGESGIAQFFELGLQYPHIALILIGTQLDDPLFVVEQGGCTLAFAVRGGRFFSVRFSTGFFRQVFRESLRQAFRRVFLRVLQRVPVAVCAFHPLRLSGRALPVAWWEGGGAAGFFPGWLGGGLAGRSAAGPELGMVQDPLLY